MNSSPPLSLLIPAALTVVGAFSKAPFSDARRGPVKQSRGLTLLRGWLLAALAALLPLVDAQAAFDTVVEHGPSTNRVNAFFLGDGYTSANIAAGTYATHVRNYVNYMFANTVISDPFFRYRNFFNIYRVNVVSAQPGADRPQNGVVRNTALDASYRFDGETDRLLYINENKANAAINSAIAGSGKRVDMRFVTVNDTVYGGGGGNYAVFAGGNSSARETGLHEMAHSFSDLADEYGGPGTYTGPEPPEVNVTRSPSGAKWSAWLGYQDPSGGVVGAYQGGRYFDRGIYRPTLDSKMRSLGVPFNAIDREKIILDIYRKVDPLDSFTANSGQLIDPSELKSVRIDDAVISTQWFVDNVEQLAFNNLDSLNPLTMGLSRGLHAIKLRAFDPTGFDLVNGWVRRNKNLLEQFVTWNVMITVPEPTGLSLAGVACCIVWIAGVRQRSTAPGVARAATQRKY